jgi:16S rRNA (adenine1518-N6/adenine1519-N6)-dimethyltransferase
VTVRAKKHLGQHFLKDEQIAAKIASLALSWPEGLPILEIGPGIGVMTKYLLDYFPNRVQAVELDQESTDYLNIHYPELPVHSGDFLKMPIDKSTLIIGNFPYNISSQILFHALDYREHVPAIGGMFQKEMAARVCCSAWQ